MKVLKGKYKVEIFYAHWYISIVVSRKYKDYKEEYTFRHCPSDNSFRLDTYFMYKYDSKGRYKKEYWWKRYASVQDGNNLKVKEIPATKEIKELVFEKFMESLQFTPFKDSSNGPQITDETPYNKKKGSDKKETKSKKKAKKK